MIYYFTDILEKSIQTCGPLRFEDERRGDFLLQIYESEVLSNVIKVSQAVRNIKKWIEINRSEGKKGSIDEFFKIIGKK